MAGVLPTVTLQLDGSKQLRELAARGPQRMEAVVRRVLRIAGNLVAKQAKLIMTQNRSVASGAARASVTSVVDTESFVATVGSVLAVKATAASSGGRVDYLFFIDRGRAAGRMPPREVLRQWIRRKLGVPESELSHVEYLVRRKIGRRGVSPRPFLALALSQSLASIDAALTSEAEKELAAL